MSSHIPPELSALATRGLAGERTTQSVSHTIMVQGIKLTQPYDEVTWTWTLPAPAPFAASFSAERWQHTLVKVFKKEPQLGDELFDRSVYVTTSDEAACLALLKSEALADAIMAAVDEGASIQIDGARVSWTKRVKLGEDPEPQGRHMALLLGSLMAG